MYSVRTSPALSLSSMMFSCEASLTMTSADKSSIDISYNNNNNNNNKKLSYRRETARQLHMTTWAGQLTF